MKALYDERAPMRALGSKAVFFIASRVSHPDLCPIASA
jgi:hypothetical protein